MQIAPTAKSNGGDVLARWRFRRKMEESQGHSQPKEETEAFCSKSSKVSNFFIPPFFLLKQKKVIKCLQERYPSPSLFVKNSEVLIKMKTTNNNMVEVLTPLKIKHAVRTLLSH